MTIKPCPFCDQPYAFELLKNHIGTVHLELPNLTEPSEALIDSKEQTCDKMIETQQLRLFFDGLKSRSKFYHQILALKRCLNY